MDAERLPEYYRVIETVADVLRDWVLRTPPNLGGGITDLLSRVPASDAARYLPLANQANRLLSPAEMGDLFKVIGLAPGASNQSTPAMLSAAI